jgi:imidazolonepropionase-like amidohydrolase
VAGAHAVHSVAFVEWSFWQFIELLLFVKAGFTNLEPLQTATINPAEYLGMLDQIGTVEENKLANLFLLSADLLVDIANIGKIQAIVLRESHIATIRRTARHGATMT